LSFGWKARSPYLGKENRLEDVIAAIEATGTYKYYKLEFAEWARRISGSEDDVARWKSVFEEHPEFFRISSSGRSAALVRRRQLKKNFDFDSGAEITKADYKALSEKRKKRISRPPLTREEIKSLTETAISLHCRAAERERDRRWWIIAGLTLLGTLLAGVIAAVVKGAMD
jgi:integrase